MAHERTRLPTRRIEKIQPKRASAWLLLTGFVTALLGGVVGFLIGGQIATAVTPGSDGKKTYTYDYYSRILGGIVAILGAIVFLALLAWAVNRGGIGI